MTPIPLTTCFPTICPQLHKKSPNTIYLQRKDPKSVESCFKGGTSNRSIYLISNITAVRIIVLRSSRESWARFTYRSSWQSRKVCSFYSFRTPKILGFFPRSPLDCLSLHSVPNDKHEDIVDGGWSRDAAVPKRQACANAADKADHLGELRDSFPTNGISPLVLDLRYHIRWRYALTAIRHHYPTIRSGDTLSNLQQSVNVPKPMVWRETHGKSIHERSMTKLYII